MPDSQPTPELSPNQQQTDQQIPGGPSARGAGSVASDLGQKRSPWVFVVLVVLGVGLGSLLACTDLLTKKDDSPVNGGSGSPMAAPSSVSASESPSGESSASAPGLQNRNYPQPERGATFSDVSGVFRASSDTVLVTDEKVWRLVRLPGGETNWEVPALASFAHINRETGMAIATEKDKARLINLADGTVAAEGQAMPDAVYLLCGRKVLALGDGNGILYPDETLQQRINLSDTGVWFSETEPECWASGDQLAVGWSRPVYSMRVVGDQAKTEVGVDLDGKLVPEAELRELINRTPDEKFSIVTAVRAETGWNLFAEDDEAKKIKIVVTDEDLAPAGTEVNRTGRVLRHFGDKVLIQRGNELEAMNAKTLETLWQQDVGAGAADTTLDSYGNSCTPDGLSSAADGLWFGPGKLTCFDSESGSKVFQLELVDGESLNLIDGVFSLRRDGKITIFR